MGWFSGNNGGTQASPSTNSNDLETPLITAHVVQGGPSAEHTAACNCSPSPSSNDRQQNEEQNASRSSNLAVTIHVENSSGTVVADDSSNEEEPSSCCCCTKSMRRAMMLLYMCFTTLIYAIFAVLVLGSEIPDDDDDNNGVVFEIALIVILVFLGGLQLLFWRWYFQKRFKEVIVGSLTSALVTYLLLCLLNAIFDPDN